MTIYIDSNIFILTIVEEGFRKEKALSTLRNVIGGKERCFTSVLALDEVLWVLLKETKNRVFAIENTEKILQIPNLHVLGMNPIDFTTALGLLKNYKTLKPRDALHVSVAKNNSITHIVSDDSDFDIVAEIERIAL